MTLTGFLKQTGSSVVYRPALVAIAGSINATILLDQLLYWANGLGKQGGQWFYMTQETITQRTGLTRYEQEGARKNLKSRGFLKEKYSGVPRKLYFQINEGAIDKAWSLHQETLKNQLNAEKPLTSMRKPHVHACRNATNLDATMPHPYKQYPNTPPDNTTSQCSVSEILILFSKTPFNRIPETAIIKAIEHYGFDHVFNTADILAFQTANGKPIGKPAAYFASCLKTGVQAPDGFVPFVERQARKDKNRKKESEAITPPPEENIDVSKLVSDLPFMREKGLETNSPSDLEARRRLLKEQALQLEAANHGQAESTA